jgi:hypothetical protein
LRTMLITHMQDLQVTYKFRSSEDLSVASELTM